MRTGILLLGIFASAGAWAADLSTKETTSPTGAVAGNGPTKGTPSREKTRNLSARLDGILSGESSPYPASANGPDLILEWALTDPAGLLNYIVARKDYASVLVATLGSVATSQGEEFVSSLVNRLPESHRGVFIDSAAIAWVNKDPAAAAKWMSRPEIARLSANAVEIVGTSVAAGGDPSATTQWLASFPASPTQQAAYTAVFRQIASFSLDEANGMLIKLTSSSLGGTPAFDAACRGVVEAVAHKDSAAALTAALLISNSTERQRVLVNIEQQNAEAPLPE